MDQSLPLFLIFFFFIVGGALTSCPHAPTARVLCLSPGPNLPAKHRDSRKFRLLGAASSPQVPGGAASGVQESAAPGAGPSLAAKAPAPERDVPPLLAKAAAAGVESPFVQQVPSPRGVQLVEFESHCVKVALPAGTDLGLPGRPGRAWSQLRPPPLLPADTDSP